MKVVNDPDIDAVGGVLQLAQDAILSDPKQLASQLVARLYEVRTIFICFFCSCTSLFNKSKIWFIQSGLKLKLKIAFKVTFDLVFC